MRTFPKLSTEQSAESSKFLRPTRKKKFLLRLDFYEVDRRILLAE
jgi:hypothetical protein